MNLRSWKTHWPGWLAVLLMASLPFTSFPLVGRLSGSSMVAPLALLPLILLIVAWYLPFLLRAGRLPPQSLPLLAFCGAAVLASLLAYFLPVPSYQAASLLNSELEAIITLVIGAAFYLVIASWAGSSQRLVVLLRWVNWSGLLIITWSLIQAGVWYQMRTYPDWMWDLQAMLTTNGMLYQQRAAGFAYEPSWLAHQLNMLYLPYWLGAAVSGYSAHRLRVWRIHFEHLLLLAGVGVLLLSVSRVGMLAFLLMVAYLLLWSNIRLVRWLQSRLFGRFPPGERRTQVLRFWFGLASLVVLVLVYGSMLIGAGYGLSRYDQRMAKLFDLTALREQSFLHYANQLVFAERIVFWQAGWQVFNDHPLIGVGLGNAGFYFPETLSPFSWALTEVRMLMYRWTSLPNIKSLWVRILAETGLVGFAFFVSWCYVLWQSARFLTQQPDRMMRALGLAGSFVLVGLLIEGFSVDTFALPYYWVSLGLVTAACESVRCLLARSPAAAIYSKIGGEP
jgi:hypothetical protein